MSLSKSERKLLLKLLAEEDRQGQRKSRPLRFFNRMPGRSRHRARSNSKGLPAQYSPYVFAAIWLLVLAMIFILPMVTK